MKVYSPTQTTTFDFCPQARQFYVEGWQPRIADKPMIASWIGLAMGAGLEAYYKKDLDYIEHGLLSFKNSIDAFRAVNGAVEDADLTAIPNLLLKALTKYPKMDPIPTDWKVLAVEYEFTAHGKARADLIVETQYGIAVADFKWKKSLYTKSGESISQARGRTLVEYENYWNMLHYMWALWGAKYEAGKTPDPAYYIILGELSPSPHVTMQRFEVDLKVLSQWGHTARRLWAEMSWHDSEDFLQPPQGNTTHRNQYGLCKYYDACFSHFLDREKMATKYVQIERSK